MEDNQLVTNKVVAETLNTTQLENVPENKLITYGELLQFASQLPTLTYSFEFIENNIRVINWVGGYSGWLQVNNKYISTEVVDMEIPSDRHIDIVTMSTVPSPIAILLTPLNDTQFSMQYWTFSGSYSTCVPVGRTSAILIVGGHNTGGINI